VVDVSAKVGVRSPALVVALASLLLVAVVIAAELASAAPIRVITVFGSTPEVSIRDRISGADAIAVLKFTGESRAHWNSADGREWKAASLARGAWIYRDDVMEVVQTFRGNLPPEITVRSVGGVVEDVRMDYDGQPEWPAGQHYLVLLERQPTPTKESFEEAWTPFYMDLGVFVRDDNDGWRNVRSAESLAEADLK